MAQFYNVKETSSLEKLIGEIDAIQAKINSQKPLAEELWTTVQEKLRIEWTYGACFFYLPLQVTHLLK
jgi:hypothetical protein